MPPSQFTRRHHQTLLPAPEINHKASANYINSAKFQSWSILPVACSSQKYSIHVYTQTRQAKLYII